MKHFNKNNLVKIIALMLSVISCFAFAGCKGCSSCNGEEKDNITKIFVSVHPKLQYEVEDEVNYEGLVIGVIKEKGKTEYVAYNSETASEFTFSGFNSVKAVETQEITVKYKGFSCTYTITVKEKQTITPLLLSIEVSVKPKVDYKLGEGLDVAGGMLLLTFSDGSTKNTVLIKDYITQKSKDAAFKSGETGVFDLKVIYEQKETGIAKDTTYQITISAE